MEIKRVRDLSLIALDEKRTMVIACDSCGGIGMKEGDTLKVPPFYVGKLIARVPLLEVLCTGASVITITDAVCNEMENTGIEIIKGIKAELSEADIEDIVLTGSTEENMTTSSTALGITIVGIVDSEKLKVNKAQKDALIISIGLPKVGGEINIVSDEELVSYTDISRLLSSDCVYEIVPVGSKGIAYEAQQLALNNKLVLHLEEKQSIDIKKSSGPATCVIAAVNPKIFPYIKETMANVNIIGYLGC
jgi:hypothetical protein